VPGAARAETTYTFSQVQSHAQPGDCWSIVNGGVYNLTAFINRHEGGPAPIKAMCGLDGTASYNGQHGKSGANSEPAGALSHYRIGVLDPTSVPTASDASYTLAQVAAHATPTDCWSVVSGGVYNLTKWGKQHPGGAAPITAMCGVDGTAMYLGQHKGSASANAALAQFKVGSVSGATSTTAQKSYTMKQVRRHNTATNCWSVVNTKVYNLTKWIAKHPGGRSSIVAMCGKNGSKAFRGQHAGSPTAAGALKAYKIGRLV
jgi:cytochrome b involved in lipid metabolism